MNSTPSAIFAQLKKIAPNISFKVSRSPDHNFRWDGDGPDPAEDGYVAYDVDVYARTIIDGEVVEGRQSLGGSYDKPGEFDSDIHGYLPQMLEEAATELAGELKGDAAPLLRQLAEAKKYLKQVLSSRYASSMRRRR